MAADASAFEAAVGPLFEDAPAFLARLAAARPFGDWVTLFERARGIAHAMPEAAQVEIAAQLPVDAREQVEVERRRDARRVVIGRDQGRRVLHQIDAHKERRALAQQPLRDRQPDSPGGPRHQRGLPRQIE